MDALDEMLAEIQQLLDAQQQVEERRREGENNFRCVRCTGCNDCRFCIDCRDCDDCTYCESCTGCSGCTQSKACRDCNRTSHSFASRACDGCSYVTLCVGCEDCVHCFGCVGISGAEFCVLNEKLSRKDYQAKVAELRAALDRRMAEGWLPPWLEDDPSALDELADFDDLDGIAAPPPRDPLAHAQLLAEPTPPPAIATPPIIAPVIVTPPVEPTPAPAVDDARGHAPRSVVRAGRPTRPAEPTPEPVEPTSSSRLLVARRPPR
ncbi:MAG TPA: hypothetical protein VG755_21550 [Nannocystaceae bacterium]|nr:hypothetical protein [Nannocystaceae bacterium]